MRRSGSSEFEDAVAEQISSTGTTYQRYVPMHGIETDFLIQPSSGRTVVIDVKDWEPTPPNLQRAARQAELIQQASGSTEAYVVLPGEFSEPSLPGVIPITDVPRIIGTPVAATELGEHPAPAPKPTVFAAMPFASEYDDVFFVAMAFAAEQTGTTAKRVDREPFEGDVVDKICQMIRDSVGVIADLSDALPNVMYEVGYAHALERPTIHICSTPLSELPFDVRNWNTLAYKKGQTFGLREKLAERLKAALKRRSS